MPTSLDHAVSYKALLASVGATIGGLALFAAWLIGRAEAAVAVHVASPNPHPGIEEKFERVEGKIDALLWAIVDDRKRKGYEPADPPAPAPDPVPPWVKAGKKK